MYMTSCSFLFWIPELRFPCLQYSATVCNLGGFIVSKSRAGRTCPEKLWKVVLPHDSSLQILFVCLQFPWELWHAVVAAFQHGQLGLVVGKGSGYSTSGSYRLKEKFLCHWIDGNLRNTISRLYISCEQDAEASRNMAKNSWLDMHCPSEHIWNIKNISGIWSRMIQTFTLRLSLVLSARQEAFLETGWRFSSLQSID